MARLAADGVVLEAVTLDPWYSGFDTTEKMIVNNQVYWAKDIDFKIRFVRYQEDFVRLFVEYDKVKVLPVPPARRAKMLLLNQGSLSLYYPMGLLSVQTLLVLSYCTSVFLGCEDDKGSAEISD